MSVYLGRGNANMFGMFMNISLKKLRDKAWLKLVHIGTYTFWYRQLFPGLNRPGNWAVLFLCTYKILSLLCSLVTLCCPHWFTPTLSLFLPCTILVTAFPMQLILPHSRLGQQVPPNHQCVLPDYKASQSLPWEPQTYYYNPVSTQVL